MIYSKAKLDEYASPLSDTEKEQCQNAIDMVKEALVNYGYVIKTQRNNYSEEGYAYYYELRDTSYSTITILLQGSYANNTNIKRYSDVDVSVIYSPIIPLSLDKSFMKFKEDIYNALVKKFGSDVERKNKSICVSGNTYRKSIDVVPAFSITNNLLDGIQFLTDKGEKIINYPLKQILNENKKNKDTGYKFKRYVRIIKNIKEDMEASNISSAKNIGSFQVESLLWNISDEVFTKYITLGYGVEEIIQRLIKNKHLIPLYKESNGIKQLCNTPVEANKIQQFIDNLNNFFTYGG